MQAGLLVDKTNAAAMGRLRLPFAPPSPLPFASSIVQLPPTVVMLGVSASHLSEVPVHLPTSFATATIHNKAPNPIETLPSSFTLLFELNLAFQSLSSS